MDIKNESIVPGVPKQGYKSRHTKSSTKIWNDNITNNHKDIYKMKTSSK